MVTAIADGEAKVTALSPAGRFDAVSYTHLDVYKRQEEGFPQLAALFTMVAQIEKEHEERYRELAENLKNNKVFAREEQQVWQCRNCGYTYIGKSAPLKLSLIHI